MGSGLDRRFRRLLIGRIMSESISKKEKMAIRRKLTGGFQMKRKSQLRLISALCLAIIWTVPGSPQASDSNRSGQWTETFHLNDGELADHGENRYFILEPGFQLTLEGIEDEDTVILIISVLKDTKNLNGINTRIVEERESVNGNLVEVSRNYFAFCPFNGSVFYFGEDVDIYENGVVVSHDGAWHAGNDKAQAGLMMPGLPLLGARYYQEIAPQIAMDRAEIINLDGTLETPAGIFENCLVTEESSQLEPNAREAKVYAPGIGLIQDGKLLLTRYGFAKE